MVEMNDVENVEKEGTQWSRLVAKVGDNKRLLVAGLLILLAVLLWQKDRVSDLAGKTLNGGKNIASSTWGWLSNSNLATMKEGLMKELIKNTEDLPEMAKDVKTLVTTAEEGNEIAAKTEANTASIDTTTKSIDTTAKAMKEDTGVIREKIVKIADAQLPKVIENQTNLNAIVGGGLKPSAAPAPAAQPAPSASKPAATQQVASKPAKKQKAKDLSPGTKASSVPSDCNFSSTLATVRTKAKEAEGNIDKVKDNVSLICGPLLDELNRCAGDDSERGEAKKISDQCEGFQDTSGVIAAGGESSNEIYKGCKAILGRGVCKFFGKTINEVGDITFVGAAKDSCINNFYNHQKNENCNPQYVHAILKGSLGSEVYGALKEGWNLPGHSNSSKSKSIPGGESSGPDHLDATEPEGVGTEGDPDIANLSDLPVEHTQPAAGQVGGDLVTKPEFFSGDTSMGTGTTSAVAATTSSVTIPGLETAGAEAVSEIQIPGVETVSSGPAQIEIPGLN